MEELVFSIWNENVNSDIYEKWVERRYIRDSSMEADPKADEFFVVLAISDFFQEKKGMWSMAKKTANNKKMSEQFNRGLVKAFIEEYLDEKTKNHITNIGNKIK